MDAEKVTGAILLGLHGFCNPSFPEQVKWLNQYYVEGGDDWNIEAFLDTARESGHPYAEVSIDTTDNYFWHTGIYFATKTGSMIIALPWSEWNEDKNVHFLERSIAIYVRDGTSDELVSQFLDDFSKSMRKMCKHFTV